MQNIVELNTHYGELVYNFNKTVKAIIHVY